MGIVVGVPSGSIAEKLLDKYGDTVKIFFKEGS